MHYDVVGYLSRSRGSAGPASSSSTTPAVAMSVARRCAPELCSMDVARISRQTPWTCGEGAEIRLEPMAKEWFQKEVLE